MPLLVATVLVTACSTTSRLGENEVLYTGVDKFKINTYDGKKLTGDLPSELTKTINVKPNNPLFSPYVRTPFPVGLWIYNHWNDSARGLKGWLYRKLVKEPVLVSDVNPQIRTKMLEDILDKNGYFNGTATYDIQYDKRNKKKARINYTVNTGKPYLLDSIIYLHESDSEIAQFIDSLARKSDYLQPGSQFCEDSLQTFRLKTANLLRNRGFYYFTPDFITYLADSIMVPGKVVLKLALADNMPGLARQRYKLRNITTTLLRRSNRSPGVPDTLQTSKGELIVMRPQRLRKNMIPSCITFRPGRYFSVRNMDRTQTRLSRLGIFSSIELQPVPVDTTGNAMLDLFITCRYDRPMQAQLEVNVTSKSNSYLGPGLTASLTHNNIFGGAEKLTFSINANYEWQTGHDRSSLFNSYEFGFNTQLSFPRLLAPNFLRRTQRELNWTRIDLGASVLNRPHYFRMSQFNTGLQYEWRATRHAVNQFTPFKLKYTKLQRTTPEFDSLMNVNPAIALSFQSQFIPQLSWSYTLDKFLERAKINGINFNFTLTEAGNLFSQLWKLGGAKGEKKLFGTPFSQFIKGEMQFVYSRLLVRGTGQWLVTRLLVGAEHAYGNSREVPYSEQFYIGGANSIRAFTVRSLGPGSYRAPSDQVNGYFDQTGTFKLEANVEYRFPIAGMVHGAVFMDTGNIWLLKNDPLRPGGKLNGKDFLRDLALGTGVGLRFDFGMIVLRGDLGYGLHAPYADYPKKYFNIAFKKAFAFHLAIGYPF